MRCLIITLLVLGAASMSALAKLWTPSELTTTAWYDADDADTIIVQYVSQWNDKSGNGNHVTQATATRQPLSSTRTLNGLNVLDFDGGDLLMNTSFTKSSLNVSYVQVFKSDLTGSGIGAFIGFGRSTLSEGLIRNQSANETLRGYGQRYPNQGEVYFNQDTNTHVVAYVKNGTSSQFGYLDGTAGTERTNFCTTWTSQSLGLGAYQDGSANFNGELGEAIVFDSTLSETDRQKIEGYLAWKWGLQGNLPAGHPYESSAPRITHGTVITLR